MKKRSYRSGAEETPPIGADLAGVVSFEYLNACPVGRRGKDDV